MRRVWKRLGSPILAAWWSGFVVVVLLWLLCMFVGVGVGVGVDIDVDVDVDVYVDRSEYAPMRRSTAAICLGAMIRAFGTETVSCFSIVPGLGLGLGLELFPAPDSSRRSCSASSAIVRRTVTSGV